MAHPLMEMEEYCDSTNVTDEYEFMNVSAYIAHLNGTIINPVVNNTVVQTVVNATAAAATTAAGGITAAATTAGAAATANMAGAGATAHMAAPTGARWPNHPMIPNVPVFTAFPNPEVAFTTLMTNVNETTGNGTDAQLCGSKAVKMSNQPNTALLSAVLMFGTFLLANAFKIFKTSHYLGKTVSRSGP